MPYRFLSRFDEEQFLEDLREMISLDDERRNSPRRFLLSSLRGRSKVESHNKYRSKNQAMMSSSNGNRYKEAVARYVICAKMNGVWAWKTVAACSNEKSIIARPSLTMRQK